MGTAKETRSSAEPVSQRETRQSRWQLEDLYGGSEGLFGAARTFIRAASLECS
jgi:hypothetical protein